MTTTLYRGSVTASYSRRDFLRLVLPLPVVLAACRAPAADPAPTSIPASSTLPVPTTASTTLPATPSCDDGDDPTPEQTAGPFYVPDSPERSSLLEEGIAGDRLVLSGSVLWTDCRPVTGALLDFWQADAQGVYDNQGYRLRGHQFADSAGRYRLETIVPGNYQPRTRHIHVRVQAPDRPVLTTQLYFPGEPRNAEDGLFDPLLLVERNGSEAHFDFVLEG